MDARAPVDQAFFQIDRKLWRDAGYLADRTLDSKDFLCRFPRFAVVHSPEQMWLSERILRDPAWQARAIANLGQVSLWMVSRRAGAIFNCQ